MHAGKKACDDVWTSIPGVFSNSDLLASLFQAAEDAARASQALKEEEKTVQIHVIAVHTAEQQRVSDIGPKCGASQRLCDSYFQLLQHDADLSSKSKLGGYSITQADTVVRIARVIQHPQSSGIEKHVKAAVIMHQQWCVRLQILLNRSDWHVILQIYCLTVQFWCGSSCFAPWLWLGNCGLLLAK